MRKKIVERKKYWNNYIAHLIPFKKLDAKWKKNVSNQILKKYRVCNLNKFLNQRKYIWITWFFNIQNIHVNLFATKIHIIKKILQNSLISPISNQK